MIYILLFLMTWLNNGTYNKHEKGPGVTHSTAPSMIQFALNNYIIFREVQSSIDGTIFPELDWILKNGRTSSYAPRQHTIHLHIGSWICTYLYQKNLTIQTSIIVFALVSQKQTRNFKVRQSLPLSHFRSVMGPNLKFEQMPCNGHLFSRFHRPPKLVQRTPHHR